VYFPFRTTVKTNYIISIHINHCLVRTKATNCANRAHSLRNNPEEHSFSSTSRRKPENHARHTAFSARHELKRYVRNTEGELCVRGVSKKFGEWYQKTNKTEDTNTFSLFAFKIIAILHNKLLATFIKLLETVSKGLFRNRSQNRCHMFLDCRHVCKTWAFHDALKAYLFSIIHRTPLIWRLRTSFGLPAWRAS
jgi:hypothetical protein